MKHGELGAIAHNIADSMASGLGLLVGFRPINIYAAAAKSPDGHVTVDLLSGAISGGPVSPGLAAVIADYCGIFPDFCARHGGDVSDFAVCRVRFWKTHQDVRFRVTVRDAKGRESETDYAGNPAKRVRRLAHF